MLRSGFARGRAARGDRAGIWSPKNAEWVIVQVAAAKIGAILVNTNPSYRAHEFEHADYRELLAAVDTPKLRHWIMLGDEWDELLALADLVGNDAVSAREAEAVRDEHRSSKPALERACVEDRDARVMHISPPPACGRWENPANRRVFL